MCQETTQFTRWLRYKHPHTRSVLTGITLTASRAALFPRANKPSQPLPGLNLCRESAMIQESLWSDENERNNPTTSADHPHR